jgi:hypothetical protein
VRAFVVLSLSLAQAGCVMQSITTEITFAHASEVALTHDGQTVVAPRSGETTQPLASGRAESFGVSAAYDAKAVRSADDSLWIEWNTKLPIMEGERMKVLGSEPLVFNAPLGAIFSKGALDASSFVLPLCGTVGLSGYRFLTWHAHTNVLYDKCSGTVAVPYALETDWSNVVIHQKTRADRGLAWMTIALSVVAFTPFAVIMDTASPKNVAGGVPTQIGFTIGIGLLAAAFTGAVMPTLFASDQDVYVRR